jgi:hypothetical protein
MQAPGRGTVRPPIGIALDGDFGNRIDAVLAIAMLNGLAAKSEARRIALCESRCSLKGAQVADVVSAFYAPRPIGARGGVGGNPDNMIGLPEEGPSGDPAPLAALLSKKGADGALAYTSGISQVRDTAENAVLIRNVLLAQNDGNAAVVLAGPATGLARLTSLFGAKPQLAAKAKHLVAAVGAFPAGSADPSIKADLTAARKLFAEWPAPLVAVGAEVGAALPYPGSSLDADLAWAPVHPVADAYRANKPLPYDAPASALAAVLYAAHPDAGHFKLSEPGTIRVLDDGRTQFMPDAGGLHRYLVVDPEQTDRISAIYREMVSAQPAQRPGRRGGDDD